MGELIKTFPKHDFLELISSGLTEPEALSRINFPRATYTLLLIKDADFKEELANAKMARADKWFEDIATSVAQPLEREEVAAAKLKFDQRKYLAAIDNPDKYGERVKHQHDIAINIFQEMKELPVAEARRILAAADPFAEKKEVVEVEYVPSARIKEEPVFEITPEMKKAMSEPMELEEDIFS